MIDTASMVLGVIAGVPAREYRPRTLLRAASRCCWFEGAAEVTISVNGTEIMRPIAPCENQEGRVRVINFEADAGQSIVVRVERPDRLPARPRR